jgi:hypothetical protein
MAMVAVLTLGVGMGARTAIFRLIHTVSPEAFRFTNQTD